MDGGSIQHLKTPKELQVGYMLKWRREKRGEREEKQPNRL
jgi:hypothetical protein